MTSFLEKHSIHRLRAGDIIFREGSVGNAMYIIQIGEVDRITDEGNLKIVVPGS
ncbi:hypothetical protein JYT44_01890 [Caldithrix abyssi]|nr:hypothetical protein [Caldithrix abyssi]